MELGFISISSTYEIQISRFLAVFGFKMSLRHTAYVLFLLCLINCLLIGMFSIFTFSKIIDIVCLPYSSLFYFCTLASLFICFPFPAKNSAWHIVDIQLLSIPISKQSLIPSDITHYPFKIYTTSLTRYYYLLCSHDFQFMSG